MTMWHTLWRPGTDWRTEHAWFLFRDSMDDKRAYRLDARAYMIRYASFETAQRAADELNAAEATS